MALMTLAGFVFARQFANRELRFEDSGNERDSRTAILAHSPLQWGNVMLRFARSVNPSWA